ncbi:MAG: ABC transporter substrate-binding protein [Acidimicrobiales bacterium]|nr:ABC transporter substrate-binding protein [Acidimicrobiales bacterium]
MTTEAPAARPKSLEEWETLWAKERAAIVKRITDEKLGTSADGSTLEGPAGFSIDLSACPPGWSDTEGVSDTAIKIGSTNFFSGAAADYGNLSLAQEDLFNYYSEQGAFKDSTGKTRKIDFIYKDDGYDPARTIPLTDELIDSDKVFAVLTNGSPTGLKVYQKLNDRCIPQPLESTAHPAWGDPVHHPWTTGSILSYATEAALWGSFIDEHIDEFGDGKIKVAALVANNDFGNAYVTFFNEWLTSSKHKDRIELITEKVEFSTPTITDPMTTLAAQNPQVFIAMTGGAQCTQSVLEAAQNGMQDNVEYRFLSATCKGASFVGKDKVGGDGSVSDGWWIVGGGSVDLNSSSNDADAYVVWAREQLAANGHDYKKSGSFSLGVFYAFPMIQALRIAGELPGGLSRTNLVLALRAFDMTHPMLLPGVEYKMDGNDDAFFGEASDISKYDAKKQEWVQQGAIVQTAGAQKKCRYDAATSGCELY